MKNRYNGLITILILIFFGSLISSFFYLNEKERVETKEKYPLRKEAIKLLPPLESGLFLITLKDSIDVLIYSAHGGVSILQIK
jgi:hypothetical protein